MCLSQQCVDVDSLSGPSCAEDCSPHGVSQFTLLPTRWYTQLLKWNTWSEGNPLSAWAPSHEGRAHQMLMLVNIRCHLPATSNCRQLFCTDVVIWSYTTLHVAFRFPWIVTKLEVQERYLPIITGAGTQFPVSQGTLFISLFKHQRQRARATYMPVKWSTIMHWLHWVYACLYLLS